MRTILVDGSNISLYSAGSRKLTTLVGLARVINALLAHKVLPYTIFDASFRYVTDEKSIARTEFTRLTKQVGEYFPLAPSGEEADLFLLEAALATGNPILSNDMYRVYGGVKNGVIRYKGHDVLVYNFSVIAGSVIIPDLEIRHMTTLDDDNLDDIGVEISAIREAASRKQTDAIESGESANALGSPELDSETLHSIDLIVREYVDGGVKPLDALGRQLTGYKQNFLARTGVGKNGKRVWFGFPTLRAFVTNVFPRYKIGDNSIEKGDDPSA